MKRNEAVKHLEQIQQLLREPRNYNETTITYLRQTIGTYIGKDSDFYKSIDRFGFQYYRSEQIDPEKVQFLTHLVEHCLSYTKSVSPKVLKSEAFKTIGYEAISATLISIFLGGFFIGHFVGTNKFDKQSYETAQTLLATTKALNLCIQAHDSVTHIMHLLPDPKPTLSIDK